jgi:hypothetical protein
MILELSEGIGIFNIWVTGIVAIVRFRSAMERERVSVLRMKKG